MKQLRVRVIVATKETCPVLTNGNVCNIYQAEGTAVCPRARYEDAQLQGQTFLALASHTGDWSASPPAG
jgi:hypothetical protein